MPYANRVHINLQSVIDTSDQCFVIIDKDYRIIAANKAYCESYNTRSEEIIGQTCHRVSHHSDSPCHINGEDCPHKKVFETRERHQVIHMHYDRYNQEECVRIKGSPIYGTDGELYLGETFSPVARSEDFVCNQQRMLGTSPAFLACVDEMSTAATTDLPVLLLGECGVGKELAARYIHKKSARKAHPFIAIDCTAISEGIFESELFGHEQGAFTGCVGRRNGLIDAANNGTLFLDCINELPYELQGRILRALETGTYRRLGGREDYHVDCRIICSTSSNLQTMIDKGEFRSDLYYRIAGITVSIPALRERQSDIKLLTKEILKSTMKKDGSVCNISEEAMQMLLAYTFPGNIRELNNILHKAVSICTTGIITPGHLTLNNHAHINPGLLSAEGRVTSGSRSKTPSTNRPLSDVEATYIESLLHQYKGHRAKVAEELCISERTLYRKLKQYNLSDIGKK